MAGRTIDVPAHPMVAGATPRSRDAQDFRELHLSLREQADDAADSGDMAEAAELLLELGASLHARRNLAAAIGVLDEALDTARASGEAELVERAVGALERAMGAMR